MCIKILGEWISGATCMYVANELVERFNSGDELVSCSTYDEPERYFDNGKIFF